MHEDLDRPREDDWNVELPITLVSCLTEGSSRFKGSKRPKKPDAHDKNPQYPPKEYTNFLRPIAMALRDAMILFMRCPQFV